MWHDMQKPLSGRCTAEWRLSRCIWLVVRLIRTSNYEIDLHDGDAHEELLHLAQEALYVLPGPHAQLGGGAPVELSDGAQGCQTRHRAGRHPQRFGSRLQQQIRRLHTACKIEYSANGRIWHLEISLRACSPSDMHAPPSHSSPCATMHDILLMQLKFVRMVTCRAWWGICALMVQQRAREGS